MKFSSAAGGLLALALILTGCEQATTQDDSGPATKSLTVLSTSTYVYYSLTTGAVVSDPTTQDWDIALSSSTAGIRTNSGSSATVAGSAGLGGVYYTGKTSFAGVKSYDADGFDGDFAEDAYWYVSRNQGDTDDDGEDNYTTPAQSILNVITKLDYASGDGLASETTFVNEADTDAYDGDAWYSYDDSGNVSASGEVYIIRHGDGSGYSKFQVVSTSTEDFGVTRTRVIKYANF